MGHLQLTPAQLRYLRSIGLGTPHGKRPERGQQRASRFVRAGNAFRRLLHSSVQLLKALGLGAVLMSFAVGRSMTAQETPAALDLASPPTATTVEPVASPTATAADCSDASSPKETMKTTPTPSMPPASPASRPKRHSSGRLSAATSTASPTAATSGRTSNQGDGIPPHGVVSGPTNVPSSTMSTISPSSQVRTPLPKAPPASESPAPRRSLSSTLVIPFLCSLFGALAYSVYTVATLNRAIGRFRRREVARVRRDALGFHTVPTRLGSPDFDTCASIPEALDVLLATASGAQFSAAPPEVAPSRWGVGIATHCGHVRSENQDFGIAFRVAGCDVVCLADGLGGLPRGLDAARAAVAAAAWSAVQTLQAPEAKASPHLVSEKALLDAAAALASRGICDRISGSLHGFRTTLMVLTATPNAFGLAYAGDGGGVVVHASGEVEPLLLPQKANGQPNVVAASLGPILQGEPQIFLFQRCEGDVVLLGTDGVFDRTPGTFPKAVVRALVERDGDAKAVATSVVTDLAGATDASGYICDDNLSIAIVGPGTAPVFGPGFWQPVRR